MSDSFDKLLVHTCNVYERATGWDDYDASTRALNLLESGIACRLSTQGPGTETHEAKQTVHKYRKLYMHVVTVGSLDEDISEKHVVEVLDANAKNLGTFNVISVENPSNVNHHLELYLDEVRY